MKRFSLLFTFSIIISTAVLHAKYDINDLLNEVSPRVIMKKYNARLKQLEAKRDLTQDLQMKAALNNEIEAFQKLKTLKFGENPFAGPHAEASAAKYKAELLTLGFDPDDEKSKLPYVEGIPEMQMRLTHLRNVRKKAENGDLEAAKTLKHLDEESGRIAADKIRSAKITRVLSNYRTVQKRLVKTTGEEIDKALKQFLEAQQTRKASSVKFNADTATLEEFKARWNYLLHKEYYNGQKIYSSLMPDIKTADLGQFKDSYRSAREEKVRLKMLNVQEDGDENNNNER